MTQKRLLSFAMASALCALSITAFSAPVARAAVASKPSAGFQITQKPKVSNWRVASPVFDAKVRGPNRSTSDKKWAAFEVGYRTQAEWIDEIAFTFHVMLQDQKTKLFHYFSTSVSYIDIAKGEHGACVMLPPAAIARYGEPVSFGCEITIDGEKVGTYFDGMGGDGWWNKLGEKIVRHSGYLVDRSKTPFGLTYIDEYEVTR